MEVWTVLKMLVFVPGTLYQKLWLCHTASGDLALCMLRTSYQATRQPVQCCVLWQGGSESTLQPGPLLEASAELKSCCREKYVEMQLAKRLGRTDAAADAAPLDAQQRAEQELYGVPDNLKARRLASSFVKAG